MSTIGRDTLAQRQALQPTPQSLPLLVDVRAASQLPILGPIGVHFCQRAALGAHCDLGQAAGDAAAFATPGLACFGVAKLGRAPPGPPGDRRPFGVSAVGTSRRQPCARFGVTGSPHGCVPRKMSTLCRVVACARRASSSQQRTPMRR